MNINDINVPTDKKDAAGKNVFNPMGIGQIYTDDFTPKCWEYYDILVETVRDELIKYEKYVEDTTYLLSNQQIEFKREILELSNQVISESDITHTITERRMFLENEIDEIEDVIIEHRENLKDLKESSASWWEQYNLREEDIDIKFNEPSNFFALREKQMFTMKVDNYNSLASDEMMSKTYLQKWLLGWTDNEILQNAAMRIKDSGFRWELAQIETNGPDFREKTMQEAEGAGAEADGMGGMEGFGGGGGGLPPAGGGGSDTNLPEFGAPTEGGGGEAPAGGAAPAATEAPAPAAK